MLKLSSSRGIRIDVPVLSVSWSFEDHSVIIQALRKGLIEHEASDTGGVPRWQSSCPDRLAEATDSSLHSPHSVLYYQWISKKHALLCLHPEKLLFLSFGHFAASNPYNYVAVLVLYGTQGSIRGLNWWEYNVVVIVAKVQCQKHRRRENSCVLQVDQYMSKRYFWRSSQRPGVFRVDECIELI